jgi:hypothetical protein
MADNGRRKRGDDALAVALAGGKPFATLRQLRALENEPRLVDGLTQRSDDTLPNCGPTC